MVAARSSGRSSARLAVAPKAADWQMGSAPVDQVERDSYACTVEAEGLTGPPSPAQGAFGLWANRANVKDLHARCMRARGYQRVP